MDALNEETDREANKAVEIDRLRMLLTTVTRKQLNSEVDPNF